MADASNLPLKETWQLFQEEHPKVRIRDAAAQFGVSEAQLLATGCGENATRLSVTGHEPWLGRDASAAALAWLRDGAHAQRALRT